MGIDHFGLFGASGNSDQQSDEDELVHFKMIFFLSSLGKCDSIYLYRFIANQG
jgi:hypothetical protein